MKPFRLPIAAIAFTSVAAIACRSDPRDAPGGNVSLSSAAIAEERPIVAPPAPAVCDPSDAPVIAAAPPRASAPRAPRAEVVPVAAKPKPKTTLDEAIAASIAAQPPSTSAPEGAPPAEPIGTGVTTTSATVLAARPAPALAPTRVVFDNRLPDDYRLERARVLVDGVVAYDARAPGAVWISPGPHAVQVIASYRMSDPVLTYLRGYRIEIQSTQAIPASGTPLTVEATARPTGGVTTPVNQAAAVQWRSFPSN